MDVSNAISQAAALGQRSTTYFFFDYEDASERLSLMDMFIEAGYSVIQTDRLSKQFYISWYDK